jgi:hypothetical protein
MRAGLLATDRPMLMVPAAATKDFGHRVAIAWCDDDRRPERFSRGRVG